MKHAVILGLFLTSLQAFGQTPQLPFNPDENGDGLIGVADLQAFLALYSTEFAAAVSNGDIAFINLGNQNKAECMTSCNFLPGKWSVTSHSQIASNWNLFADAIGGWSLPDPDSGIFWLMDDSGKELSAFDVSNDAARFNKISDNFWNIEVLSSAQSSTRVCVCAITQRPKIEYKRIDQLGNSEAMTQEVNELLNLGWYIESSTDSYMHLWRWKDD